VWNEPLLGLTIDNADETDAAEQQDPRPCLSWRIVPVEYRVYAGTAMRAQPVEIDAVADRAAAFGDPARLPLRVRHAHEMNVLPWVSRSGVSPDHRAA